MVFAMVERMKSWIYGIKADKLLHFITGLLVAQVAFLLINIGMAKWASLLIAFVVTALVGGIKEFADKFTGGVPNWKDFVFTLVGGFVGLLIMSLS